MDSMVKNDPTSRTKMIVKNEKKIRSFFGIFVFLGHLSYPINVLMFLT